MQGIHLIKNTCTENSLQYFQGRPINVNNTTTNTPFVRAKWRDVFTSITAAKREDEKEKRTRRKLRKIHVDDKGHNRRRGALAELEMCIILDHLNFRMAHETSPTDDDERRAREPDEKGPPSLNGVLAKLRGLFLFILPREKLSRPRKIRTRTSQLNLN